MSTGLHAESPERPSSAFPPHTQSCLGEGQGADRWSLGIIPQHAHMSNLHIPHLTYMRRHCQRFLSNVKTIKKGGCSSCCLALLLWETPAEPAAAQGEAQGAQWGCTPALPPQTLPVTPTQVPGASGAQPASCLPGWVPRCREEETSLSPVSCRGSGPVKPDPAGQG